MQQEMFFICRLFFERRFTTHCHAASNAFLVPFATYQSVGLFLLFVEARPRRIRRSQKRAANEDPAVIIQTVRLAYPEPVSADRSGK